MKVIVTSFLQFIINEDDIRLNLFSTASISISNIQGPYLEGPDEKDQIPKN